MPVRLLQRVTCPLVLAVTLMLAGGTACLSAGHGQEGKEIERALQARPIPGPPRTLPWSRAHAVEPSPFDANVVYSATPGGLFVSDDGGESWNPWPVDGTHEEVFSLAVHPTAPDVVCVGRRDGLWQTRDGGRSWAPLAYPTPGPYIPLAVAIAESQPNVLYMTTARQGVYQSGDGGYRWMNASKGLPEARAGGRLVEIRSLVVHPRNSDTAYIAHERHGVYRTTDGGASWHPFTHGLRVPLWRSTYPPRLAFDPDDPNRLFLLLGQRIHSHLVKNRLYVTSPAGKWLPVEVELPSNVSIISVGVDRVKRVLQLWGPDTVWEVPVRAKVN